MYMLTFWPVNKSGTVFPVKERLWICAISNDYMSWEEDVDDRHSAKRLWGQYVSGATDSRKLGGAS